MTTNKIHQRLSVVDALRCNKIFTPAVCRVLEYIVQQDREVSRHELVDDRIVPAINLASEHLMNLYRSNENS